MLIDVADQTDVLIVTLTPRRCRGCNKPITSDPPGRGRWLRYCSESCQMANRPKKRLRWLRSGERVPAGEPRRYVNREGYILLRWTIATNYQVEVVEHRIVDGVVTDHEHVHHRNRDRTDNRSVNLDGMTADEHMREHADHRRRINPIEVVALYKSGMSQPEIAAALDCNSATVSRALHKAGARAITYRERFPFPPQHQVIAAHRRSTSAVELAGALDLSVRQARAAIAHYGLQPYPVGRRRADAA